MLTIDIEFFDGKNKRWCNPLIPRNLVTVENEAVWGEYLSRKIGELVTLETMESAEFKAAERKVREEELSRIKQEMRQERHREDYCRRKVMERPRIGYIPEGPAVDYEKEYGRFLDQEVTYQPVDRDDFLYLFRLMNRWQEKSVPQIIESGRPDAAYAVAIELCRHIPLLLNRDDLQEYIKIYKVRIRKFIIESFSALVTAVAAWDNKDKHRYVSEFILGQSQQ